MTLFRKLTDDATIPTRDNQTDGYKLVATGLEWDGSGGKLTYSTGITLGDVPHGFMALIYPLSSVVNTHLRLAYCGGAAKDREILVTFDCPLAAAMIISKGNAKTYSVGDPIAQIVFHKVLPDVAETEATEPDTTTKKKVKT